MALCLDMAYPNPHISFSYLCKSPNNLILKQLYLGNLFTTSTKDVLCKNNTSGRPRMFRVSFSSSFLVCVERDGGLK